MTPTAVLMMGVVLVIGTMVLIRVCLGIADVIVRVILGED